MARTFVGTSPPRGINGMDWQARWLEFFQDDPDLAARDFIPLEQPDRNDADPSPPSTPSRTPSELSAR